jgi:hypothetical protein
MEHLIICVQSLIYLTNINQNHLQAKQKAEFVVLSGICWRNRKICGEIRELI